MGPFQKEGSMFDCTDEWIDIYPMERPLLLVKTARIGARHYRRDRDLPGAIAGLLNRPPDEIIPRLARAEAQCEDDRRAGAAAYRPGRHVQILAALLAESRMW